jgi:hypothetical protein
MYMAITRVGSLVALASMLWAGAAAAAEDPVEPVAQAGAPPEPQRPPIVLGLMADAGVPDGANAALVLRPAPWVRLHAGGGTNTVSAGYRGGITLLLPMGVGPSLSLEVGHFRDGNANGLVRRFAGTNHWPMGLFDRMGYTYVNGQLGLDFGSGPVQFFVHAGLSHLTATIHNANLLIQQNTATPDASTTVVLREDPVVRVWTPSVKMGLIVYLGSGR